MPMKSYNLNYKFIISFSSISSISLEDLCQVTANEEFWVLWFMTLYVLISSSEVLLYVKTLRSQ